MATLLVDYESLAQHLQSGLNATTTKYHFTITPQIGDYEFQPKQGKIKRKKAIEITGILLARPSDLVPIKDYAINTSECTLILIVPKMHIIDVYNKVAGYIEVNNANVTEAGGRAIANFSVPTITNLMQRPAVGSSAEIRVPITIITTLGTNGISDAGIGVMSNDVTVTLAGLVNGSKVTETVTILQGTFSTSNQIETANVSNDEQGTSTALMQNFSFNGKLPYLNTPLMCQIVRDIFSKALDKTYEMTYRDPYEVTTYTVILLPVQMSLSISPGTLASIDINMTRGRT